MKKLILLGFLSFCMHMAIGQEAESSTKKAVATYNGYSTEGYYFTNELDQGPLRFDKIMPEVLQHFDLKDELYKGETFRVNYTIKTVGNKDELTILSLEKIDYDTDDDDGGQ